MYRLFGKRLFDLALAIPTLIILLPMLLLLYILVRINLGSPVIFRQRRPGLYGEPFTLYKLRTMTDARDASGDLLPDASRLTPFGRFLRSSSLDELPELFNVLKGEMSLVGPRPLLMRYIERYSPEQMRRHDVRPGITGLAQISGRNAISWQQKFALDVEYVDHHSLWRDIHILATTVMKIVRREGISQPGHATAEEFQGNAAHPQEAPRQNRVPTMKHLRNRYFLLSDVLLIPLAIYISFVLRLDRYTLDIYNLGFLVMSAASIFLIPLLLYQSHLYQQYWRYASVHEVLLLSRTVTVAVVLVGSLIIMARHFIPALIVPRTVPLIALPIILIAVSAPRLMLRFWWGRRAHPNTRVEKPLPVLIMGAGDAGALTLRELQHSASLNMAVLGLLDDDRRKHGMRIHGVRVIGDRNDIPRLVQENEVLRVIIAMPQASGKDVRAILQICQEAGVEALTIPGLYELLSGTMKASQLRNIEITDLLRREQVDTDIAAVRELISDRRVMVTGGGGSIGSELCRQVLRCEPSELIVLGHGENSVFEIQNELQRIISEGHWVQPPRIRALIADIRDAARVRTLFERHRPAIVFHAAAHKHVPLMEDNPVEAITNNVLGTRNLIDAALVAGVERFVMISSDKAVNPTSVMGASKRVAEMLVHRAAQISGKPFVAVRFGNVLGSRGSVVLTFKRQIAAGGPVTVTDPEMRRYFMTIPEAVQLLLQAAVLGTSGEVFMLDMGEPVKVVDLARDMIRLSGLEVGRDIDIAYSGVRPGEKLFEELFAKGESYGPTCHHKIFIAANASSFVPVDLLATVSEFERRALANDDPAVVELLHALVPEFQSGSVATNSSLEPREKSATDQTTVVTRSGVAYVS